MIETGWDIFGVPETITSDQGPQFAARFFRTICARLGVRQAFSHAYRPQGNGRAEMAGKQLITLLRKLNAEGGINWVEALPRALYIHHGIPGETGLSPHHIVFGRDRNVTGIPCKLERECEDARDFIDRMLELDRRVLRILTEKHQKAQNALNRKRKARSPLMVGDTAWYLRPKGVGGNKISTWWTGPYRVHARTGASSYTLEIAPGTYHECHPDQLKPGPPNPHNEDGVSLFFNRKHRPCLTPRIESVLAHDSGSAGNSKFRIRWSHAQNTEDSWVAERKLNPSDLSVVSDYCEDNRLPPLENFGQALITESPNGQAGPDEEPANRAPSFSSAWFEPDAASVSATDPGERECADVADSPPMDVGNGSAVRGTAEDHPEDF